MRSRDRQPMAGFLAARAFTREERLRTVAQQGVGVAVAVIANGALRPVDGHDDRGTTVTERIVEQVSERTDVKNAYRWFYPGAGTTRFSLGRYAPADASPAGVPGAVVGLRERARRDCPADSGLAPASSAPIPDSARTRSSA